MTSSHALKLLLIGTITFLVFAIPQSTHAAAAWCDTDWSNRKSITISNTNVDSDLTDFPLLISVTDTDLAATAKLDATDIFFTAETTCDKLKWEKESYTSATGVLVAWVKVPTVDADANTTLYMYYGNAAAADQTDATNTWDTNYKAVWHLSETPDTDSGTDEILDSTTNDNDGDTTNMVAGDQVAGNSGGALDFDGDNDYVDIADMSEAEDFIFTYSVWALTTAADFANGVYFGEGGGGNNPHVLMQFQNDGDVGLALRDDSASTNGSTADVGDINDGNWHHIVGTGDGSTSRIYINGTEQDFDDITISAPSLARAAIGVYNRGTPVSYLKGTVDEVRVSSSTRTAAWIKFSYHSQKITAGTITLGSQDIAPGGRLSPPSEPEGGFKLYINPSNPSPQQDSEQAGQAINPEITTSPNVTLTFNRGSDTTKIAVSNKSDVLDTSIERIQSSKSWNICLSARQQHLSFDSTQDKQPSQDCPPGTYTIYIAFYTEQLMRSPVVSDTIIYEKPVPLEPEEGTTENTESSGQTIELEDSSLPEPNPRLKEIKEQINLIRILIAQLVEQLNLILSQR